MTFDFLFDLLLKLFKVKYHDGVLNMFQSHERVENFIARQCKIWSTYLIQFSIFSGKFIKNDEVRFNGLSFIFLEQK